MRFFEAVQDVYFDDLDAFRVLHNARYVLLFERTIGAFWRRLGWGSALAAEENPDQFHLVRSNHIEYLRPVVGTGQVRVRASVARIGRTSLTFDLRCLAMDEDTDHATGTRVIVRVDPQTRKPVPWSASFRERLSPYTSAAGDPTPLPAPTEAPSAG